VSARQVPWLGLGNSKHALLAQQSHPRGVAQLVERRIHVILRREGWLCNRKRVQRLWRDEGLRLLSSPESGGEDGGCRAMSLPPTLTMCGR
jgi:HTH-like domain